MQKVFGKMFLLFISIIFFALSCLAPFYFYREIINNNKESELAEKQWQTEASRREEVKILDLSVKIIEGEKIQLETHFAQSSDIVPFLNTIEGLASKVEVKAEVASVDILGNNAGLLVEMKALGTFSSLYKFLTLLENSPYELDFISVDIYRQTGLNVFNANIETPGWEGSFKIKLASFI